MFFVLPFLSPLCLLHPFILLHSSTLPLFIESRQSLARAQCNALTLIPILCKKSSLKWRMQSKSTLNFAALIFLFLSPFAFGCFCCLSSLHILQEAKGRERGRILDCRVCVICTQIHMVTTDAPAHMTLYVCECVCL